MSVGALGAERQITNVAAGQLNAGSTDAVNGSQLFATNQAVESIAGTAGNSVQYDDASRTTVTLNPGGGSATTITNVAAGVNDSDAVNMSQLNTTNTNVTNLDGRVTTIYDTGTKYFHANSTGADSQAIGANSVAIGQNAVATADGSVALGLNSTAGAAVATAGTTIRGTSYNFAGAAPVATVSVGALGAERQITNVAAGQLNAGSTDAVNGTSSSRPTRPWSRSRAPPETPSSTTTHPGPRSR